MSVWTIIQWLHHLESKFLDLGVCIVNVGTLRGRSGEILEMLEHNSVDICSLQETRFQGKIRMICGKAAECKLQWIRNEKGFVGVGIFLAKKW